jgi:hypothetical protein
MLRTDMIKPLRVKYVTQTRPQFPSEEGVLAEFIRDNNLPRPKTTTPTQSRGVLACWANGDQINVYSLPDDLSGHFQERYGLQGMLNEQSICLLARERIPRAKSWGGEKLTPGTFRDDDNTRYFFLGIKPTSS